MFFDYAIKIPIELTEENIQSTIIQLKPGVVNQVDVIFPPGCAGFAHLRIFYQLVQIFPLNISSSLASDDEKITWRESLVMEHPPYQLIAKTWNDDQCYPHTLRLRFAMFGEPIPPPPDILLRYQIPIEQIEEILTPPWVPPPPLYDPGPGAYPS